MASLMPAWFFIKHSTFFLGVVESLYGQERLLVKACSIYLQFCRMQRESSFPPSGLKVLFILPVFPAETVPETSSDTSEVEGFGAWLAQLTC